MFIREEGKNKSEICLFFDGLMGLKTNLFPMDCYFCSK